MLEVIWQLPLREGRKDCFTSCSFLRVISNMNYYHSRLGEIYNFFNKNSNHTIFGNTIDQIKNWNLSFPLSHFILPIPPTPIFSSSLLVLFWVSTMTFLLFFLLYVI